MSPDTDDLTTLLQRLGESATVPGDANARIAGALHARRRRRRLTIAASAVATAAAVIGVVAVIDRPTDDGPGPTDRTNGVVDLDSSWQPIAPSPLAPRHGSVSAWTGTELLVIGGVTAPPCPPNADCSGPTPAQLATDAAAYDPAADSWRSISAPPRKLANVSSLWIGDQLLVFDGDRGVLSYDPAADDWRTVTDQTPPGYAACTTWTGEDVVCVQSEERGNLHDWLLDPATGRWTKLPADPFPATFDRSLTWSGDTLYFTGLLTADISDDAPDYYQFARYDPGTGEWTTLDPSPVGFWDPRWYWFDDRLVNPAQDALLDTVGNDLASPGGVYDPATSSWEPVAQTDVPGQQFGTGCQLPAIGPAGRWLAGGGPVLVSVTPGDTAFVPPCGLRTPDAAAWTGDAFIVWGGPSDDYRDNTGDGYRWTPPRPG